MMARYLIPKPIQRKYELFPGWGMVQAGIVVAGIASGALFGWGISFLAGAIPGIVVFVALAAIGGALAFPPPGGIEPPLYQKLQAWRGYTRTPKKWLYDWNSSDWPD